jgi:choline monooxygenase
MNDLDVLLSDIRQAAERPWDASISLPPQAYTSEALLQLEREKVFRRSWICVGRADEISAAGAFMTSEIDRVPLAVVRQQDGSVKALANVCSHRAMAPVRGAGVARAFTCPYHGWTYNLDGSLRAAPGMAADFSKAGKGLREVRVEEWLGFLFVNLDKEAESLAERLKELTAFIADYEIDRMKTFRRDSLRWSCNWKLAVENGIEPYHIPATHPISLAPYIPVANIQMRRPHATFHAYHHKLSEAMYGEMPPNFIPTRVASARVKELSVAGAIYPNIAFALTYDWLWWISCQPISCTEVRVDHGVAAAFDLKGEKPDPDDPAYSFLAIDAAFMPEDVDRVEGVQRGVASGYARQSRLAPHEEPVHGFIRYLSGALGKAGETARVI